MKRFSRQIIRRSVASVALVCTIAASSGCGGSGSKSEAGQAAKKGVTVALDWTPNTNHIGAFVADQLGYYANAGLKVKFIPYASTQPELIVAKHRADFGFSYQAGTAYARSAGGDVRQVFANIAKNQYAISVRGNQGGISSPKQLDGKTYAGFGTPDEGPELKFVIKKDGGSGKFRTVMLNSSAYQAVYGGQADFTISVSTWEGIEAKLLGKPMRYFEFSDYGLPSQYSSAIVSSDRYLKANPETAKAFLAATQSGYQYAKDHPEEAAKLLVKANPQTLKNPELVTLSAKMLAAGGYYGGADGQIGHVDPSVWSNYGDFLQANKLLVGSDGKPLAKAPDWSSYYTNAYLPAQ